MILDIFCFYRLWSISYHFYLVMQMTLINQIEPCYKFQCNYEIKN